MAYYLFDTSALIKRYHREPGHATMMELFTLPKAQNLISELTVVELHSAIAKKVRVDENLEKIAKLEGIAVINPEKEEEPSD
jgi:predicted nucleic acid-binding protein